jgi:hypothetical protein
VKGSLLLSFAALAAAEPGYDERTVGGWHVLVEQSLARQNPEVLASTMDVLRAQLQGIARNAGY